MRISNVAYNPAHNPWGATVDAIAYYYRVRSESEGGTFLDAVAPSAANYPDALAGTPTDYHLFLPLRIYRGDLTGSYPMTITDETTATPLSRVTGIPGANEYRIPPDETSIRMNTIQLHSGQAGHTISFDYYGEASMFDAEEWNKKTSFVNYHSSAANYTIPDKDYYDLYVVEHSTTTGLITRTLPTLAANYGRVVKVKNGGTYAGLTKLASEEGSNIIFNETHKALSNMFICDMSDEIDVLGTEDGWLVLKYECNLDIGYQNVSDTTNRHQGNGVTYDNGSGTSTKASDWTGEKFTEATSNIIAICIEDTGGSGTTGNLHFYKISGGVNYYTNNRVLTASNGETIDVNHTIGTSVNADFSLFHNLGLGILEITKNMRIQASTDGTEANAFSLAEGAHYRDVSALTNGWQVYPVDALASIKLQTGDAGFAYIQDNGTGESYDSDDWYLKIYIGVKK